MTMELKSIPAELMRRYKEGNFGFLVGAGLSKGAGFPDWMELLMDMIAYSEEINLFDHDRAEECRKLMADQKKYLVVAEEMKEVLGVVGFKQFLEGKFLDQKITPKAVHDLMVKIPGQKFIITTNYDKLIEQAYASAFGLPRVYKYYEADAIQRALFDRHFFILKAHGDAETAPAKIILTGQDYRQIIHRQPGYQSVMNSIFTMYSVVFLGSSIEDPELMMLINFINSAFPEGGIPHYALMPISKITNTEQRRWLKDHNIQIVPISEDNDYQDIELFLQILVDNQ